MAVSIPSKPEELTSDWLSEAFHEMGYLSGSHVENVSIELLDPSNAIHSTLARIHLEFSTVSPQIPTTMVAKLISSNPAAADRLRRRGGDQAETCFYQQIGESAGLRVPKCLFSRLDEATGRYIIILEDLSTYRSPSAKDGLSDHEISAVVRSLAASHAAWWDNPRLNDLSWLRPLAADAEGMQSEFRVGWPILVERLGSGIAGLDALGEQLTRTVAQAQEGLTATPTTFLHMDVRLENLFFAGSDENPTPIFIDWQNVRRGRGAAGLASFLTFLSQRDRLEDTLLMLYHSELKRAGVNNYPFEEYIRDYRMGILRRFAGPAGALGTVGPDNPQGAALIDLLSRFGLNNLERYLQLLSEG